MAYIDSFTDKARELSYNTLKGGKWDTEAFIVASLCELLDAHSRSYEDAPDINKLFTNYYNEQSLNNLEALLSQLSRLICELYHYCDTPEERELFSKNMLVCRADIV